jgi:hypothetical protein
MEVIIQATSRCFVVSASNLVALKRIGQLNNSANLILVSPRRNDPTLQNHLSKGRVGVTTAWNDSEQTIVILTGEETVASFGLDDIPGRFLFRSKSVNEGILYAIGAVYGAGLTPQEITNSLKMLQEMVTLPKS